MKSRFIKATIIATGIGLLGGCASVPQVAGQGATPTQRPIIFNMKRFTPIEAVRVPGMVLLPFDGSLEDVRALKELTQILNRERTTALLTGHYEIAGVLNQFHARFAALRYTLNYSTNKAIDELQRTGGKTFTLDPGAIVTLLAEPGVATATMISLSNPFDPFQRPNVQVADNSLRGVGEALRLLSNVTGTVNSSTRAGRVNTMLGLEELPPNIPFAMENGTILVRRQTESGHTYTFYNPLDRSLEVPLKDLGYVPPPPPLSELRQRAAPIMVNMGKVVKEDFESKPDSFLAKAMIHAAPEGVTINGPYFAPDGTRTNDPAAIAQTKRAFHSRSHPYKTATTLSIKAHRTANDLGCGEPFEPYYDWVSRGRKGQLTSAEPFPRYPVLTYQGASASIVRVDCYDKETHRPFYSQSYFVGEDDVAQTAYSLLRDTRVANKLKSFDDTASASMDISQVFPIVGNVVSGIRCVSGGDAQAVQTVSRAVARLDHTHRARPLVAHLYEASLENQSLFSQPVTTMLDCASALPAVGTAAGGGARLVKLLGNMVSSLRLSKTSELTADALTRFETAAGYFKSSLTTPGSVQDILRARDAAPEGMKAAITVGLTAYTIIGKADNIADAKNGLENAPWVVKKQ